MKWLRHMTATWSDEKIAKLTAAGGKEGLALYGAYWRVLEIVASQMKDGTNNCSVSYDVNRWATLLGIRGSHVCHYMGHLSLLSLVTCEWNESDLKVTIPKLVEYKDEYTRKLRTNSGETLEKPLCVLEGVENHLLKESTSSEEKPKTTTEPEVKSIAVVEDPIAEWFKEFYERYPLHKARKAGLQAARVHLKDPGTRKLAMKALLEQLDELEQRPPDKRPYPATWINGKRWEDEPATLFARPNGYADKAGSASRVAQMVREEFGMRKQI